jgi:sugar lactone lactonase YvrE
MKRFISIIALVFALVMIFAVPASAFKPYQTYTYSIDGFALHSPDAYTPVRTVDSAYMGLEVPFDEPRDIVVDESDNVYLVDSKNDRVVVLDKYFKFKFDVDTFVNEQGVDDCLNNPNGVFVKNGVMYVCDTDNARIVTFDTNGNFLRVIAEPESSLFDEGSAYMPIAVAVDDYGKLYVVSMSNYEGVIVMDYDGEFICFVGAQKVSLTAWEKIWRMFQTDEQRELSEANISTTYNNITIDADGFIYITTDGIDEDDQYSAMTGKDKSGDFAPVKKLNPAGDEVMARNGFWPPSGELDISLTTADGSTAVGASKIVDVAVGPEKTWSIIDEKRSKIFTYDEQGNLLFAFGDFGSQLGNLENIEGICYMSDGMLLVLDKILDNITVYQRTEYGDIIIQALANQNSRQYDRAIDDWFEILKRNSNFDAAYIGIGDAYYRNGEYELAQDYYKAAYDTEGWSKAYAEIRKEWIGKYVWTVPIFIVAVVLIVSKLFKKAAKVNKHAATAGGKRTFVEELVYGFHLIFHPFDGFWDLKHEKRGSLRAALVYLVVTVFVFFYQAIGSGYLVNPYENQSSVFVHILGVLLPIMLWVISNWCLTTLFEGEGSLKDIFIACCYALLPIVLIFIPTTIASNFVLLEELDLVNVLNSFAFIWAGLLIFSGMMITHDYTVSKNFVTVLGTLIAMVFVMFVAILFTTLVAKIVSFIANIVTEIGYRL